MVKRYSQYIEHVCNRHGQPLPFEAICAELVTQGKPANNDLKRESYFDFDIVGFAMQLHHFKSHTYAMEQLSKRLRPGGLLLIVDFCPTGSDLGGGNNISANGFSEKDMLKLFCDSGLIDSGYVASPTDVTLNIPWGPPLRKTLFVSWARKAVALRSHEVEALSP